MHSTFMANRTYIQGFPRKSFVPLFPIQNLWIHFRWRSVEELATKSELVAALAVGHESEVTYFSETMRKNMGQESANKVVRSKLHGSDAIVFFAILPLKNHGAILKRDQAVVRNGNAVGIAAQVIKDLKRPCERTFGVYYPVAFPASA